MSAVAPRDALAAATRRVIEDHAEWDSPHSFQTLHWDGEKIRTQTYCCIMPDVDPLQYTDLMSKSAREQVEKDPDDPACAYLLQIECFGVTEPGPDATEAEKLQYHADRIGRTFHKRDDAVESAVAWCADVHGRVWTAAKVRGRDGITEKFYAPGRSPGGHMIRGLLSVAYATGMLAWGLPGPQGPMN